MNRSLTFFVAHNGGLDQSFLEAARVALEAKPTPPLVDHDAAPIEIPEEEPSQQSLPTGA